MRLTHKNWIFGPIVILILGLTLQKVFSLNLSKPLEPNASLSRQKHLLLTETDGVLPKKEAWKVLAGLDHCLALPYTVGSNEWLEKIAKDLKIPAIAIRSTNNLEDPQLRPRQEIIIQNKSGMVHISKQDEPLEKVIQSYLKLGAQRQKILAGNSLDDMTYMRDNQLYLKEGSKVWIPDARRSYPYLSKPVNYFRISSRFGVRRHPVLKTRRRHDGYDMAAPYGSPVYSGQTGVVVFAGWLGGYGNAIDIRHDKITTRYGHLSAIFVSPGQRVKRRQMIGRVGSTGLSTGPHLHFEVRRNSDGKPVRPGRYLY